MPKTTHTHYDAAEARALRNSSIPGAIMESAGSRFDSVDSASVFFARELDHVKQKSYDVQYPELTALSLFPISNEADEGAETITYYTYDKSGLAKIIDNYSTDLPRADVTGKPSTAQIRSIGDSYGYSVQEIDYDDTLSEKLMDIINNRKTGDDLKTTMVDVLLKPGATSDVAPTVVWAYREDCVVVPGSSGGNTVGVQAPFTIYKTGNRTKGTFDIKTKKFTVEQ